MRHYQIFAFGPGGQLLDAVAVEFENDNRVIRHVIGEGYPHGCELWEGFRFVGRFHGASPPRASAQDTSSADVVPPRTLVH